MPVSLPPLNRRRFLQAGLAATVFAPSLWADTVQTSPDCWAFLSDTHIPGDRNTTRKSAGAPEPVNPVEHLSKVRADLLSKNGEKPVGVIVCGDCVYLTGQPEDYVTLLEEFKPIRQAGLQVHFVMGNHDNREVFLNAAAEADGKEKPREIPDRLHSIIETPRANFFLLDSLEITNRTPGRMGEKQLDWLADELDARKDKPAILFAHHYPDYTGAIVDSPHALLDTEAFYGRILRRKQVKAYIFGHSHFWKQLRKDGVHLINVPAVAWRFDPTQPLAWVLAKLRDDGMSLTLRSIDPEHPKHDEVIDLSWRM